MKPVLFFLLTFLFWSTAVSAQETHSHADGSTHAAHGDESDTPAAAKPGSDHFTVYGESDKYELTLYYPELAAGQEAHMKLFVADYLTNRPVDKADLTISAMENPKTVFEVTLLSPGVYELRGAFPENKSYSLNVQIAHPNGADLIGIPGVVVGRKLVAQAAAPPHSHTPGWIWFLGGLLAGGVGMWYLSRRRKRLLTMALLLAGAWFSSLGSSDLGNTVDAPKETQFLFEITTQLIAVGEYHSATAMFGAIVPASGGMGIVVAPQSGRITRVQAKVGQTVRAGQTLAVLQQNVSTPEQVGIVASNAGLAIQIETARTRVTATRREFERLQKIADIAAAKDVQAAEATYQTAQSELQILEAKAIGANASANNRTIALVAPISGVLATFILSPGAEVVAGQTLFTVTNLDKVYVEAQVYDNDVPIIRSDNRFIVTCSTDDHKSAEVRLISQAQTMNPGNQSQRVFFEMDNPKGEFKIGEFVTIKALNQQTSRQITAPNAALTEINGKTAVFIKTAPEKFALRYVQTGEDDGARTVILKGLEEGDKVVVNGTYEVKMMYL